MTKAITNTCIHMRVCFIRFSMPFLKYTCLQLTETQLSLELSIFGVEAASSVTFDLLIIEMMFLFFKNKVKMYTKIKVYILPFS